MLSQLSMKHNQTNTKVSFTCTFLHTLRGKTNLLLFQFKWTLFGAIYGGFGYMSWRKIPRGEKYLMQWERVCWDAERRQFSEIDYCRILSCRTLCHKMINLKFLEKKILHEILLIELTKKSHPLATSDLTAKVSRVLPHKAET